MQGLHPKLRLSRPFTDEEYYRIMRWMGVETAQERLFLEAGSGMSPYGIRLAKAGRDVVAVDISRVQLAEASRRAESQNIEIQFICADIGHLPLRSESFSTVICVFILHHIYYALRDTVAELARVLRKRGEMVAFEPNSHHLLEYFFYHPWNPLRSKSSSERPLCPSKLRRALAFAGFSEISIEPQIFYSSGFPLPFLFKVCIAAYRPVSFILRKIDPRGAWHGNYLVISAVK